MPTKLSHGGQVVWTNADIMGLMVDAVAALNGGRSRFEILRFEFPPNAKGPHALLLDRATGRVATYRLDLADRRLQPVAKRVAR